METEFVCIKDVTILGQKSIKLIEESIDKMR